MRHNGRPAIIASSLLPTQLDIREAWRTLIECPACKTWQPIKRSMIFPHRHEARRAAIRAARNQKSVSPGQGFVPPRERDGRYIPRCGGSGQRVVVDVSVQQWRLALAEAIALAGVRATQAYLPTGQRRTSTPPPSLRQAG